MAAKSPDFLLDPTPHTEAVEFIRDKPAVAARVFGELLPELRARAFTIAGVEQHDTLQRVRDLIAEVPAGGDWDKQKKAIVAEISPFLVTSSDPDDRAREQAGAVRRAELLLRLHGFQAYAASSWRVMDAQRDVFPYWRYQSMGDGKVRATHAALDGKILPAGSDFWRNHYPPWEWGCRCQVVPMMEDEVDEIRRAQAGRPLEQRDVIEGAALARVEGPERQLVLGPTEIYDLRTQRERTGDGYEWSPGDLRIPLEELRQRYDAAVWQKFEAWAQATGIPETGATVWQWLGGQALQPAPPPAAGSSSFAEALALLSLQGKTALTLHEANALIDELKEDQPAMAGARVSVARAMKTGALTRKEIEQAVQDFVSFLPPKLFASLPPISVHVSTADGAQGFYDPSKRELHLSKKMASNPDQARTTIFHELAHWVHLHGPADYAAAIKAHFQARTAGETLAQLKPYNAQTLGKRDRWYEAYAGRIYGYPLESTHLGLEVPTRYLQLLSDPVNLVAFWNDPAFRETFEVVAAILYKEP